MFGLSPVHLFIIFVIVLLFGAKRIPEVAKSLGTGLREFKKGLDSESKDLLEDKRK